MSRIETRSGCKVGWETFDNENEAKACAADAAVQRDRMFTQGYDFGYQWPGSIQHVANHPEHGECWVVVVP